MIKVSSDLKTKISQLDSLKQAVVGKAVENLSRNPSRSVATGIGVFGLPIDAKRHCVLFKIREERSSLVTDSANLQGKLELLGGGVDLREVKESPGLYNYPFKKTLQKELQEEAGLRLTDSFEPLWKDAISFIKDSQKKSFGVLDLAFVTPISCEYLRPQGLSEANQTYAELVLKKIKWVHIDKFLNLNEEEFVSPRTAYLAREALRTYFKIYISDK